MTAERRFEDVLEFLKYAWRRFGEDRCLRVAASLSYTSLLAMVPVIAIAFAILAGIPAMEGVRDQIYAFVFENFIPDTGEKVQEYLQGFVANAGRMTAVGIIGLSVVALMLLATIEAALNIIFRVSRARPLAPRLMVYWALLTLAPLLLGASFSLATYIMSFKIGGIGLNEPHAFSGLFGFLARGLPALILIFTFGLVYMVVPNRPIRWRNAMAGGVVAGLLFSGLRWGFGIYIIYFPTYKTIYGAMAVVPIFLLWMYLSWAVVLLGAVVTASLSEWPAVRNAQDGGRLGPCGTLLLALRVLDSLWQASRFGRPVRQRDLLAAIGTGGQSLEQILNILSRERLVVAAGNRWVLARDPETVTLQDVVKSLNLNFDRDLASLRPRRDEDVEPWQNRLLDMVSGLGEGQRQAMDITLKEFLSTTEPEKKLAAS